MFLQKERQSIDLKEFSNNIFWEMFIKQRAEGSEKMKIILMRHGKSEHADRFPISCTDFAKWVDDYDKAGIIQETAVPESTKLQAQEANLIVTSTLCRSIQSAKRLEGKAPILSDVLFREAEMPVTSFSFFDIKLPPSFWAICHRCGWLAGYKGKRESIQEARERAAQASNRLIQLAAEHERVLLAGHGVFNQFIARELLRAGWRGERKTGRHQWSCTSYTYKEPENRQGRLSRLS